MRSALKAEIKRLARKAIDKAQRIEAIENQYRHRFTKRTGISAGVPAYKPTSSPDRHFDPVYCMRNANFLSKVIWHKVLEGTYEPKPAINYSIPKPSGGRRSIMAFSIPDSALANVTLRRTRDRNIKRLSPSSYAYHPDKNVFDAILALKSFDHESKLFAVQIDFEKYFDNIPTWYLEKKIDDRDQISLTPHERFIFKRFLSHRFGNFSSYGSSPPQRRVKGTPQGSSISLLLANLANHDLDTALSEQAGKFVRFADDVVCLCRNYHEAQAVEECFSRHCRNSGLVINEDKSFGIGVIAKKEREIRTHQSFDYLGYRFKPSGLTIPDKIESRIKSRLSRLMNIYLITYLSHGFNKSRSSIESPDYDWDLLGLIYEMRRYLYGGLSEAELSSFIHDGIKLRQMKGLMGFYCLLDDRKVLASIDGWLLSAIRRVMVKRNEILAQKYGWMCPTPNNRKLATGAWLNPAAWKGSELPESQVPSLVRGWRSARKYFYTFGLEHVAAPSYNEYSDISSDEIASYL